VARPCSACGLREVDGAQHTRQRGADQRRDRELAAAGLRVMRLPAALVIGRPAQAVQLVVAALAL
jgi:very-short-patch-repair endonuclease